MIVKDQADVKGMPTTLGSLLFKDYYPDRDSFVAENLRKAGAVILAKATLGELGGGDTHGSAFRIDPKPLRSRAHRGWFFRRFRGFGFSKFLDGGRGTGRPGIDPQTIDLERHHRHAPLGRSRQRGGVYGCWPEVFGSLAHGAQRAKIWRRYWIPWSATIRRFDYGPRCRPYSRHVHKVFEQRWAQGRAPGILRESIGLNAQPDSEDFRKISEVFDRAVGELKAAGAEIVDPIVIPKIKELLAKRSGGPGETEQSFKNYYGRSAKPPFKISTGRSSPHPTSPKSSNVRKIASREIRMRQNITRVSERRTS